MPSRRSRCGPLRPRPGGQHALVGWAERHRIELAGLEVGPPSLEDAYLALINQLPGDSAAQQEVPSHA